MIHAFTQQFTSFLRYSSETSSAAQENAKPQAHFHKTIKSEPSATASYKIYVHEMREYANVNTEANSNKTDDNPYMEPNDPNLYLVPNILKYVIEKVCHMIPIMKPTDYSSSKDIRNNIHISSFSESSTFEFMFSTRDNVSNLNQIFRKLKCKLVALACAIMLLFTGKKLPIMVKQKPLAIVSIKSHLACNVLVNCRLFS